MRDPIEGSLSAIERAADGFVIVWYPNFELQEWLVGEAESVAPHGSNPLRTSSLEEALTTKERLVLLVPENEREIVLALDAQRDSLIGRRFPIVLFLLRDVDGQRALAKDAPSLAHWVRGNDVDPEELAEIDPVTELASFENEHHLSPEAWLEKWRSGAFAQTGQNIRTSYRAMLLEAQ